MMKLTIIIVNYNVKHFLEQCLQSVFIATDKLGSSEIIVVDNNSVDGSAKMVAKKFPDVKLIQNEKNVGFSSANNQGIKEAKGQYVLLLNPDTVIEEDTLIKTVQFMNAHPDAGGLGVKMINGKGGFLPESKRGLPTPWVAFCKMSGLSRLFSFSRLFNKYHLGYLDKDKNQKVEILSGAFMLLRKSALDKVGLLDETFFMYGEDIDLSYRLLKGGYQNYYFAETCIIHYKGESTKKGSLNYVYMFYNAMLIFANKHFTPQSASLYAILIKLVILFRAGLEMLIKIIGKILLPGIDAIIIFSGMLQIKKLWEVFIKHADGDYYPTEFVVIAVPLYIAIWLLAVYLSGGYDKPIKQLNNFRGILLGTLLILIAYALIPETWRFSRALILLGASWAIISGFITRWLLKLFKLSEVAGTSDRRKNISIIGNKVEAKRVISLLNKYLYKPNICGYISLNKAESSDKDTHLGHVSQLEDIVAIHEVNELIFCLQDMSVSHIIEQMAKLGPKTLNYKIVPAAGENLLGSNSIKTAGDLYMVQLNSISKLENRRNKRLVDIIATLVFIPLIPVLIFVVKKPIQFLQNLLMVLLGIRSWVGYAKLSAADNQELPKIKEGIITLADKLDDENLDNANLGNLNLHYAKDYTINRDIQIILKCFKDLGR
ncbi:MAG TPA: glycosyltransferase [Flavobacteriales bacterium]|nr:glycosyltransferase [Flavobacteriales bacterium]